MTITTHYCDACAKQVESEKDLRTVHITVEMPRLEFASKKVCDDCLTKAMKALNLLPF